MIDCYRFGYRSSQDSPLLATAESSGYFKQSLGLPPGIPIQWVYRGLALAFQRLPADWKVQPGLRTVVLDHLSELQPPVSLGKLVSDAVY